MNTNKMLIAVSVIPLMMGLAGCKHTGTSGGGGGGGAVIVPSDDPAQSKADTASSRLVAGETLTADPATNSATIALNYKADSAKSADAAAFAIKKNAAGGADVTVNGQTVSFSPTQEFVEDDGKVFGWDGGDASGYKGAYTSSSDQLSDALDGTDKNYLQVWQYWYDDNATDTGTVGFAVVGAETPENVVKGHAKATYSGFAGVNTAQTDARKERTRVRGDLALTADFGAGAVSGSIDNLRAAERGAATNNTWSDWQDIGGKVVLGKADISSNGFSGGSVSLDATAATEFGADISGSAYSGRFYGPDADQVGGVMNIKGKNDEGKNVVGTGYFAGEK